jgi:CPA1 family monovalent cation:H+ antiporter
VIERIKDAPNSVILQFVITFGVWILAERIGLSGVVTIVVFGLTAARRPGSGMPARLRVSSFAIWESATVVLNVLAFTLIGLQLRPILEPLSGAERVQFVLAALAILAIVIVVRILWVMTYTVLQREPKLKSGLLIGWSGMRGIVTLAAAMAVPEGFPYRDFILLSAFVVVLGTLVIQGLTLRPLLLLLGLPADKTVESEVTLLRKAALKAVMNALEGDGTDAAQRLRFEYAEALSRAKQGEDPRDSPDNAVRQRAVEVARRTILEMRSSGAIGDDAYHVVEEELDWLELSSRPREARGE